ncbi:MAG: hypothetical protein RL072_1396, partial [Actinomycetota bacterium]
MSAGVLAAGLISFIAHVVVSSADFGTLLYGLGALVLAVAAVVSARALRGDWRVWGGLLVIAVLSGASQYLASPA